MVRALGLQPANLLHTIQGSLGSQVQWDLVVLPQVHSCVHISVQAKDSDDDDDVTVTVDRDRFMDEFFEQVGGSTHTTSLHILAGLG